MKVESITVNDCNGMINFTIKFHRGINIIAGENGTGKTRLLHAIKALQSAKTFDSEPHASDRIFAINPKRNSEFQALEQIVQQVKRGNKSFSSLLSDAIAKQFKLGGFDNYSSFGELFLLYFDKLDKKGGDRREAMESVVNEFNSVIRSVLTGYEISAQWNEEQGLPMPTIKKQNMEVPIVGLSCGEAELFSLVLNLYSLREQFDIFLVDEPETHLNWHLEKLLFSYLKKFSEEYDKQLIIATHSRIAVDPDLRDSTQFLYWDSGKVKVSNQLPRDQREKLLEDAFESLTIGGFSDLTIFCEDESHQVYFEALFQSLGLENCRAARCGDSANVKSLYRKSVNDGGWDNSLFVIDGDGLGQWKEAGAGFFQLSKYCIENYGLNLRFLSRSLGKEDAEVKAKIVELLKNKRDKLFGKSKSLNFLVDLLSANDITQDRIDQLDGSEIFIEFIKWAGHEKPQDYWGFVFTACADPQNPASYNDFVDKGILRHLEEWGNKTQQQTPPINVAEP